ncbi:amino acid transporter [Paeniglutamicibacter sulfureus]|uniref:Amino acid transporter n=1 Tax=Paeniglutamicibacter sulfureus TaxID=43666 RepID=A0ABU2BF32_9MICC|nr:amino acid transporter [Paeniglutamicibacter sulfureus]
MSTAAEECTDGKKHMPKAIIFSLVIAMLLYVAATLVLTGMQNYQDIDPTAGFASAFNGLGLPDIGTIISVFAVLLSSWWNSRTTQVFLVHRQGRPYGPPSQPTHSRIVPC